MIASMTGFARTASPATPLAPGWTWETRSVNGKGLDVRLRLPSGYEGLETACRETINKAFKRGNLSLTLSLQAGQDSQAASTVTVNTALLQQLMEMARDLPDHIAPPRFDGLLALRGVLISAEEQEIDQDTRDAHHKAILAGLSAALAALAAARADEGHRLEAILRGHLHTIRTLIDQAEQTAALRPEAIRARLLRQLQDVLEAASGTDGSAPAFSEDRLLQELALAATRLDIREELDRLRAHCAQADELLSSDGACGRRLDFLCQEFNREANTLCSKSQDTELTRLGLELKAVIDQLREQVQNVE